MSNADSSVHLQTSPDIRYVMARLIPTVHDSLDDQQHQYPLLSALPPGQVEAMQQQRPVSEELSFYQWLRSLNINPMGAAENLLSAMDRTSVSSMLQQQAPSALAPVASLEV